MEDPRVACQLPIAAPTFPSVVQATAAATDAAPGTTNGKGDKSSQCTAGSTTHGVTKAPLIVDAAAVPKPKLSGRRLAALASNITSRLLDYSPNNTAAAALQTQQNVHHYLVTQTGRVKMLHCPPLKASEQWRKNEPTSPSQARKCLKFTAAPTSLKLDGRVVAHTPLTPATSASSLTAPEVAAEPTACLIEFTRHSILIREDSVKPPVATLRRIGDLSERVQVDWQIVNGTIDEKFASQIFPLSGTVYFEPGDVEASITGPLVYNPSWNAESFYCIKLKPETVTGQNAMVGRNDSLSVFHINIDRFPADAPLAATSFELICGFWHHNYTELLQESRVGIALMLITGIIVWLNSMALKYLVDCGASSNLEDTCHDLSLGWIFKDLEEAWHGGPLLSLVALKAMLLLMENVQETRFRRLRLEGKATRKLRHSLFTVLMQMSPHARMQYNLGDIPQVMGTTALDAASIVWMGFYRCVQNMSVLAGSVVLLLQTSHHTTSSTARISIAISSPVMFFFVLIMVLFHMSSGRKRRRAVVEAEQKWFALVQMAEQCHDVVDGMGTSDDMAASINEMHGSINGAWIRSDDHNARYTWHLRWCFMAVQAVVLITTGRAARSGHMPLGDFVVVNTTMYNFGNTLVDLSVLVKEILNHAASVYKIAGVLNSETKRKMLLKRGFAKPEYGDSAISLQDVSYRYRSYTCGTVLEVPTISLSIDPGQLVCWRRTDETHIGVNTIFKLLSGHLVPDTGVVKVPQWWRVVHVPVTPVLFDGTVMYNFRYGSLKRAAVGEEDVEEDAELVWEICKEIGFSPELIGRNSYDVEISGTRLRNTDRVLVSIVRAILHDVDLLLVSSAIDMLGEAHGRRVLEFLHRYVHNRGISSRNRFPPSLRHQKTVIYTTKFSSTRLEDVCDSIIPSLGHPSLHPPSRLAQYAPPLPARPSPPPPPPPPPIPPG